MEVQPAFTANSFWLSRPSILVLSGLASDSVRHEIGGAVRVQSRDFPWRFWLRCSGLDQGNLEG